jgi:D-3-phosphoglycerate dehydrogenase
MATSRVVVVSDAGAAHRWPQGAQVTVADGALGGEALGRALAGAQAAVLGPGAGLDEAALDRAGTLQAVGLLHPSSAVDLEALTRRGIAAFIPTGAHAQGEAEQGLKLLLQLHQGQGSLRGQALGLAGRGPAVRALARLGAALGMTVQVYPGRAGGPVPRGAARVSWDALLARSDALFLHLPLTPQTLGYLGADDLQKVRKGILVLNLSAPAIVDPDALAAALADGRVGGAAFVWPEAEPVPKALARDPRVLREPPRRGDVDSRLESLVGQLVEHLHDGLARGAVNLPARSARQQQKAGPWLRLAGQLGKLATVLATGPVTALRVEVPTDRVGLPMGPVADLAVAGLLGGRANEVNARVLARAAGLTVVEQRSTGPRLKLWVSSAAGEFNLEGDLFPGREGRWVALDRFELEAVPSGSLVVIQFKDMPGVVGRLGLAFGEAGVNIQRLTLSRAGGEGLAVVALASVPPSVALEALRRIPGATVVRSVLV